MSLRILKIHKGKKSKYLIWSTVVDAPISWGMKTRKKVKEFLRGYWGQLPDKIHFGRADRTGCDSKHHTFEDVIRLNCAGKNGRHASLKEIIKLYW